MILPLELISYTLWGAQWFEDGWDGVQRFCRSRHIAGLELLASGLRDNSPPPMGLVVGLHAGSSDADIEALAYQLQRAAGFRASYLVMHMGRPPADAPLDPARWPSNDDATEALVEHVLATWHRADLGVHAPDLCFENANGPGPSLVDCDGLAAFLDRLRSHGIPARLALDFGHYLHQRDPEADEEGAIDHGLELSGRLRDAGLKPTVLHLHWTPGSPGRGEQLHGAQRRLDEAEDDEERRRMLDEFYMAWDRHQPLTTPRAAELIPAFMPAVIVHELAGLSPQELDTMLVTQRAAIGGGLE